DLDESVTAYLPELELETASQIRVRDLLTHTNGIDADLFFPDVKGRDALKAFVQGLGRSCGVLFPPGEHVSYSNGGMLVAGRLLEVVTGTPYNELQERELYRPCGMVGAVTSADSAILGSTAVGHFFDRSGAVRPTDMFTLPDTWASAGSTPIGTVRDLLAF